MQKWYQNKYVAAAAVAFATGAINALLAYVTHITDGLDWRHMTQDCGVSFLGPFMILISVLPKITDILTPTVRIVSTLPITSAAPIAQAEQEIVTTAPETVVTVLPPRGHPPDAPRPEQSSDHVAAAVQRNPQTGQFARRVIPPAPPVG